MLGNKNVSQLKQFLSLQKCQKKKKNCTIICASAKNVKSVITFSRLLRDHEIKKNVYALCRSSMIDTNDTREVVNERRVSYLNIIIYIYYVKEYCSFFIFFF